MIHRRVHTVIAGSVIAIGATSIVLAQVRRERPAEVPLEVSLNVAGRQYSAKGLGSCTHAPKASIYDVIAEMWTVRQQGDGGSVQLTLWKPADGSANMFTLAVSGATNTTLSTVRGSEVSGSGKVTLTPAGKGGTLTIDAKSKAGQAIAGTIKCEAFTPHIADGGN
jgi:hypothetical protein